MTTLLPSTTKHTHTKAHTHTHTHTHARARARTGHITEALKQLRVHQPILLIVYEVICARPARAHAAAPRLTQSASGARTAIFGKEGVLRVLERGVRDDRLEPRHTRVEHLLLDRRPRHVGADARRPHMHTDHSNLTHTQTHTHTHTQRPHTVASCDTADSMIISSPSKSASTTNASAAPPPHTRVHQQQPRGARTPARISSSRAVRAQTHRSEPSQLDNPKRQWPRTRPRRQPTQSTARDTPAAAI